jgi:hypothetical protein
VGQHRGRGENRQAHDAHREVGQLTRHREAAAERHRADQHDHRLKCQRNRREWERDADLRRDGREDGHESDRAGALADFQRTRIRSRENGTNKRRLHKSEF